MASGVGSVVGTVIASVIGALASLFVERAWRRHKAKREKEPKP